MKPDKLLCYVFASIFGLDPAQKTIDFKVLGQLTNRNVPVKIFNCSVNIKTKDCSRLRPFTHTLQQHCFHGKVS